MTAQQARIVQAQADARAARARLTDTLAALQDRVSPATLVREARREIADVRKVARQAATDRPNRIAAGGGVAALVLLGWPLLRWRRRRRIAARAARIRGD